MQLQYYIKTSVTSYMAVLDFLSNSWVNFVTQPSKFNTSRRFPFLSAEVSFHHSFGRSRALLSVGNTSQKVLLLMLSQSGNLTSMKQLSFILNTDTGLLSFYMTVSEQTVHKFQKTQRQMYQYFPARQVRSCILTFKQNQDTAPFAVPGNVKTFILSTTEPQLSTLIFMQSKIYSYCLNVSPILVNLKMVGLRNDSGVNLHLQNGKYHFLRFYYWPELKVKMFSWREAAQHCSNIGGHLPRFFSRDEKDDFISMLKVFPYTFVSISICIDLLLMEKAGMK